MGIKIIFLDTDGVLNTEFTKESYGFYIGVEDRFIQNLRKIVDSTEDEVKIVSSSTWRLGLTKDKHRLEGLWEYLVDKLAEQGLEIYDVTPYLKHRRGKEIRQWIDDHRDLNIKNWIVLDDEFFYDFNDFGITPHLVETFFYSERGGLNDEVTKKAIELLNGEIEDDFGKYTAED